MDSLFGFIGAGITTLLSSHLPSSWFQRVNNQEDNRSAGNGGSLEERLAQAELHNRELEARVADLENQLQKARRDTTM